MTKIIYNTKLGCYQYKRFNPTFWVALDKVHDNLDLSWDENNLELCLSNSDIFEMR